MSRPATGENDRSGRVRVVLAEVWTDRIRPGSCPPSAKDIEHALQLYTRRTDDESRILDALTNEPGESYGRNDDDGPTGPPIPSR